MGLFLGEWTLPLKKMSNYGEIKWGIENGGYQSQPCEEDEFQSERVMGTTLPQFIISSRYICEIVKQ